MKTKEKKHSSSTTPGVREKLIQLLIDNLEGRKTKSVDFSDFCEKIVDLKDKGDITDQDVLDLQNGEVLTMTEMMEVCGYLRVNDISGLSFNKARELGHKIQFAALSYAQENGHNGREAFINSMKPMEEGIDAIYNGTYDTKKLVVLKSLPLIEKWDHKLGAEAWDKHLK